MNAIKEKQLLASEMMQTDVVTVGPKDSLHEAMTLMTESHITGLPVLDAKDHCVGVISSSHILSFAEENVDGEDSESGRYFNPDSNRWESMGLSAFMANHYGETPVGELMTPDPVSVLPSTAADEVARLMCEHQIHRILVLDEEKFLHGVISAFDFVQLAAR